MPTVDLVNGPIEKAIEMLTGRTDAAIDKLRTGRRQSELRKALPQGMSMKRMADIFSAVERSPDGESI